MRRRMEQIRISGRKPVTQAGGNVALDESRESIRLPDESDIFEAEKDKDEDKPRDSRKVPILFLNTDKREKPVAKKSGDPKIARDNANYKLPAVSLLREGERSQKLDEDELKVRARAIEDKCLEFDIEGRVTQINPGPVVTTFQFNPEAGINYSRILRLTEHLF